MNCIKVIILLWACQQSNRKTILKYVFEMMCAYLLFLCWGIPGMFKIFQQHQWLIYYFWSLSSLAHWYPQNWFPDLLLDSDFVVFFYALVVSLYISSIVVTLLFSCTCLHLFFCVNDAIFRVTCFSFTFSFVFVCQQHCLFHTRR